MTSSGSRERSGSVTEGDLAVLYSTARGSEWEKIAVHMAFVALDLGQLAGLAGSVPLGLPIIKVVFVIFSVP